MFDSKFSFTLYDTIGHIIPGTFALILTVWVFHISPPKEAIFVTAIFGVFGYVLGHILHAISSWLLQKIWWLPVWISKPIDRFLILVRSILLIQVRQSSPELKTQIKKELARTKLIEKDRQIDSVELYDYCINILLESGTRDGHDILEAKEAFYRSLIPTAIYSAIVLSWNPTNHIFENKTLIAAGTIFVIEFLFYRREYYRRIKNNQVYKQALIKLRQM